MLLLTKGTGHILQVVTDAIADVEVNVDYVDKVAGTGGFQYNFTGAGEPITSITTATTTTILTGAASTERSVRRFTAYNNHASTSVTLTVQVTDGTDTIIEAKVVLAAGESLKMDAAGVWMHYDANMGPYVGLGPIATQAEMEAGTSSTVVVTPLRLNFHPSSAKAWAKMAVTAGVPALTVSWNMTSVTDSAVCRVTPVIATDFSSVNYVILYGFECNTTTYSATSTALIPTVRNATQTATQFTIDLVEIDIGQTTDPAAWHFACFGDQ